MIKFITKSDKNEQVYGIQLNKKKYGTITKSLGDVTQQKVSNIDSINKHCLNTKQRSTVWYKDQHKSSTTVNKSTSDTDQQNPVIQLKKRGSEIHGNKSMLYRSTQSYDKDPGESEKHINKSLIYRSTKPCS